MVHGYVSEYVQYQELISLVTAVVPCAIVSSMSLSDVLHWNELQDGSLGAVPYRLSPLLPFTASQTSHHPSRRSYLGR